MEFTFWTHFPQTVEECLQRAGLFTAKSRGVRLAKNELRYEDDTLIRELYQWASAAFACGLIESPRIERM